MNRRWILRAAVGVIGVAIAMAVCALGDWLPLELGYRLNITPSEPAGIYELVPGGVARGGLVLLKQPHASAASILRRYAPANLPLIKRVAALPGDVVRVSPHGVYINGARWPESAPLAHDAEGKTLRPYPFGAYRVAAGELWVMSNHPRGLDSRYFGPVAEASVVSRLKPLIIWSSAPLAQWLGLAYALGFVALGSLAAIATINRLAARIIRPREAARQ
jgi:conjugative transfer signal peptidase TraF